MSNEQTPAAASPENTATGPPQSSAFEDFKVYKPNTGQTPLKFNQEVPDSFFNPTPADIKDAQSTLSNRTKALVDAPLQLRAVREAADKAKRERWPTARIRIKFMDQTQLEKIFPSTDKIRSIYAFVRSALREDVKPNKFILYEPPKRELKVSDLKIRDLTLAELHLAPSAVLLVKFLDDAYNATGYPAPLAPEVLARAEDLPLPPIFVQEHLVQEHPSSSTSGSSTPVTSNKGKAIPKWLAKGLKK